MKIHTHIFRPDRRHGSIVLILLILLAIMLLLASANSNALLQLRHEVNLLEQRQVKRLDAVPPNAATNVVLTAQPESK